ncbi:asparagine synthase-related protein [Streptomyces marincola]|uniref:asparagine synthase-related protein n=1 Tax=Streptomyces marincola TaxID=2878388 RepID=UPI001CF51E24|nr:asparagine synthase-related protein [Streptomyces marincola]UCM91414.1 asparagine synthase [Streptomyces marincola]
MLSDGFLVLPDAPFPRAFLDPVIRLGSVPYPSGRPWLLGRWAPGELIVAGTDSIQAAVIGTCPLTADRLTELISRVRRVEDLDMVTRALPGSFHLVASVAGVLRVQGSLAGVRRVFHTSRDGVALAGDRSDVLATLIGAEIDEQTLAARVACGIRAPAPLAERSMWQGVSPVPPDSYLRVDGRGTTATTVRWWEPPAPERSLAEGAELVREALRTAVSARSSSAGRVSADLSGGMDSTSLCFLSAEAGVPDLLTFRWSEADEANADAGFAARAARELPAAEHRELAQEAMPSVFADPGRITDTEAPYPFTRTAERTRQTARTLAECGSRTHLAGHGSDELFHELPYYLRDLLYRHPLTALTHLRGHRAMSRWPLTATIAALTDRRDLRAWWRQQADHLTGPPRARRTPDLGWGYAPLRAQEWVTPSAIEVTRGLLHSIAEQARPLAAQRAQHATLMALRIAGPGYRQLARPFARAGVRLELPYLDDRVIEAALSVRFAERRTPWRYKPLLSEAMHGILPAAVAGRSTKGEAGEDVRIGLRRNMPALLELFADSALADHGLIDPDVLRTRLLAPQVDNATTMALEELLGCETWLRAVKKTSTESWTPKADQGRVDESATTI